MKCPKCKKEITYLEFFIEQTAAPGTGSVKVNSDGVCVGEPDFDPMDLTGPDPEPEFYCPECQSDITKYIINAEDFWDLC